MKEKKKALAVVAGPYRFYQVLWLYTEFKEYEWSILLLPYGKGDKVRNELYKKCDKLGIFENIYYSNMVGQDSILKKKIFIFLKMFFYFILGKKGTLIKNIVLSQTEGKDYQVYFVGCEYSIIEGAIIGLADKKDVYIFEEGMSDYILRKEYPAIKFQEIISYIVTKMGYFSPYQLFELDNVKLCTKYSSMPSLLGNRRYKKVKQLFEHNEEEYRQLLSCVYNIGKKDVDNYGIIFFTNLINGEVEDKDYFVERIHEWLLKEYGDQKILVKRHPRDNTEYNWEGLNCNFIDDNIPAEVLTQFITNQEIVMMKTSTILISLLKRTTNIYMLFLKDDIFYKKSREEIVKVLNLDEERMIYL